MRLSCVPSRYLHVHYAQRIALGLDTQFAAIDLFLWYWTSQYTFVGMTAFMEQLCLLFSILRVCMNNLDKCDIIASCH